MSEFDKISGAEVAVCSSEAIEKLVSHVSDRAGKIDDAVTFKRQSNDASEGYGVFVSSRVSKGTKLVTIPLSQCISVDAVSNVPQLRPIFLDNPGLLNYPDEVLAIGLMFAILARGSNKEDPPCDWEQHVQTMPSTFNTTLYWSDAELQELRNHTVFHLTGMMKRQIEVDYESIHKPLSLNYPDALNGMSKELYTWALSIVYSRAIEVTTKDNKDVRLIVPLLDMANHCPDTEILPSDTFHFDFDAETVSLIAGKDLDAGEECYATYGIYPNAKLLYTYGFAVLNNPHRAVDVWTKVSPTTFAAEQKQALLQQHPLTRNQTYDFKGTVKGAAGVGTALISLALMATVRVIQADTAEMSDPVQLSRAFQADQMVSVRNERASLASLRQLLLARMRVEDAKAEKEQLGTLLLADTPYSHRQLLALMVKVEERELLQEAVLLIDSWLQQLERLGEAYKPTALF